jgi:periplasmic protein TonB
MRRKAGLLAVFLSLGALAFGLVPSSQGSPSEPENSAPAQAQLPQRVRVSQGVSQGLLIKRVQPEYPKKARKKHVQGSVVLRALITKNGDISDLQLISGPDLLVPSAMEAVKQWKYKPYFLQGQPVEVETQITVIYTLSQ